MILVFETNWTGTVHVPSNSGMLQIIARAWPAQRVRMHAEPGHLAELRRDPALMGLPNIELTPIPFSPIEHGRTHIVSYRRMAHEFRTIRAGLAAAPAGEPCLVVLLSTSATGTFAATWAARLSRRRVGVQVGFHGNLNEATGWRPRNPFRRALDTRAALEARHPVPVRYLVLETVIHAALAAALPGAAARTDVLPHAINTAALAAASGRRLEGPVRIGFVGLGTAAKGIDTFLAIAERMRARWGDRVEFVHVGCLRKGAEVVDRGALVHPLGTDALPRSEFDARLASLHYVFLPFRRGYYDLSASGALMDALTWLKPVITTCVPLTEQFFAEYGDIGALCEDEAGLEAAVETVLRTMDDRHYAAQVAALRAARESRRTDTLAARYCRLVTEGFPGLLPA